MYATYHLKADELNAEVIQNLKNVYHQREIVILPKEEYAEMEKARHNAAYEEKLRRSFQEIDEGKGIVMTMEQLRAMEHD